MKTDDELRAMTLEERIEYAPYSLWIPNDLTEQEKWLIKNDQSTSYGGHRRNKKGEYVSLSYQTNCNGSQEIANIIPNYTYGTAITEEWLRKLGLIVESEYGQNSHLTKGKNQEIPVVWTLPNTGKYFGRYADGRLFLINIIYPYQNCETPSYGWDFDEVSINIESVDKLQNLSWYTLGIPLQINDI